MGKIKIALCLSGEPRSSMFCFPYIYESFINLGPGFEVDVFVHTRKTFRAFYLYTPVRYILDNLSSENLVQKINNIKLLPELQNKKNFYLGFTANSNFILNQLLMLEGIQKSFQLSLLDNHSYNIYIRCRPDIFTDFNSLAKTITIINDILKEKYDVFIPSGNFDINSFDYKESLNQYNDQLAIGNFKGIEAYSNTLNNLEYLVSQTKELKAEHWIKKQLDYHNIKVNLSSFPINLARNLNVFSNRGPLGQPDLAFFDQ